MHKFLTVLKGKVTYKHYIKHLLNHGTIIQTGITCEEITWLCATQLVGSLLLNMLKYFEVVLNIFEYSHLKKIVESWLVYANQFLKIIQSLVPASFS